jgi:hypothetical protein
MHRASEDGAFFRRSRTEALCTAWRPHKPPVSMWMPEAGALGEAHRRRGVAHRPDCWPPGPPISVMLPLRPWSPWAVNLNSVPAG